LDRVFLYVADAEAEGDATAALRAPITSHAVIEKLSAGERISAHPALNARGMMSFPAVLNFRDCGPLAQLAEQLTFNPIRQIERVSGSNLVSCLV
jgi:hypothetical protein